MMSATTPWRRGRLDVLGGAPKLLFGRMYEDWAVEAAVFPPAGHVFCIASAGCTSMALAARGLRVTAADINPIQVDYVRSRLQGAPARDGTADRLFAVGRRLLPLLGLRRSLLRQFLELDDPPAQLRFWQAHLDTARFRVALATVINRLALRLVYSPTFVRVLPPRFHRVIRGRLARCWARNPNRHNSYAWRFFLGRDAPSEATPIPAPERVELVCADAAAYLESCPPASFIGFSLSNILDGTEPAYGERLMAAVRRSAQAGAMAVLRSFQEPSPGEPVEWAARDRSMLWGVVQVEKVR